MPQVPTRVLREPLEEPPTEKFLDAKTLVVRGFLTRRVQLLGSSLVLKSVNSHEYQEILDAVPEHQTRPQIFHHNLRFLAYSVFKVDGKNLIIDRESAIPYLMDQMGSWPRDLLAILLQLTEGFNIRLKVAAHDVKFYFAQHESRSRWLAVKNFSLCDPQITGISGSNHLGLSEPQVLWACMNVMEDQFHREDLILTAARIAATAANPKGMRSSNTRADARRRAHEEYVRNLRQGVDLRGQHAGQPKQSAETVEELLEQVRNQQAGIKDQHDLIVEAHLSVVRDRLEQRLLQMQQFSQRQIEVDGVVLEPGVVASTTPVEISEDQMRQRLQASKQKELADHTKMQQGEALPLDLDDEMRVKKLLQMFPGGKPKVVQLSGVSPDDLEELVPSEDDSDFGSDGGSFKRLEPPLEEGR